MSAAEVKQTYPVSVRALVSPGVHEQACWRQVPVQARLLLTQCPRPLHSIVCPHKGAVCEICACDAEQRLRILLCTNKA